MSGSVSLAATIKRAGLRFLLVILMLIAFLRSIAMLVIPSEARDLTLTHWQSNNQACDRKREFAWCREILRPLPRLRDPLRTTTWKACRRINSFALPIAFAKSNAATQVIQGWMRRRRSCRR